MAVRDDLASLAAREGVTVFLTTHNMTEAEKLCGQVAVIRQWRLVALGNPDELRARAGGPHVEVVGRGFTPVMLVVAGVLLVIDVALLLVAMARFQRARLILD
ncbi:MAG: hypothetical protein FJZ89_08420 [Chloroflexi bacterium]|nr:hypothetical protein [Chloroflexota bacterium]